MDAIQTDRLTFRFEHQQPILDHVDVEFPLGQSALVVGPSGCGKSTLLRIIAGLLPKYGGEVTGGQVVVPTDNGHRPRIGMLFQDPAMQFAMDTPQHEMEFTLENCQVPAEKMAERIQQAADFCQVTDFLDRKIATLSGGQQQRVALAVVLVMRPEILLLDEPFASIDEANRRFLIAQLTKWQKHSGHTLIVTDHDCHGYSRLDPRVYRFSDRQVQLLSPDQGRALIAQADNASQAPLHTAIPDSATPAIMQLNDLTIERGDSRLIKDASLPIVENKITLLTGANGVGKSTLFKALTRLIPYRGNISYRETDIAKLSPGKYHQQVGMVFQQANDQFLNVTVAEELTLSAKHQRQPVLTNDHLQTILEDFGLAGMENRVVYSLSGGQRKKLQLLVMLMIGHPVLLLDEPFAGLDRKSLAVVIDLIKRCQRALPQTIVIISHQLAGLDRLVDYHLHLADQRLTYLGGE
ncbi:ATP-binding cassette domain-containing protein [Limosilactobacillus kribbianus]|uniref:ATP-binding cassette domain-containing protein n=1 Tax=Limosilactobacillus kribbianus TaxID=2982695 RepID=UPI0022641CEA|nr:ABC transporter ATP-binding protein [Limosilactobacillus kribbianus]